ncbi:MAG: amino acid ABC transporter permease [Pseudomonadota bacterium]
MSLVLALGGLLVLGACGQNFGWHVVDPTLKGGRSNLEFLISGFWYTILLSLTSLAISIPMGLIIGLCGLSSNRFLSGFNRTYVEFVRAIPLLVLILWVYYGLPELDVRISLFWSGVIALAIGESAFQAEIFRGGIQSVPRGQVEAAKAISLSPTDTMRYVILPQAIKRILPAMGNQFIYVVKMSSLVSIIGAPELTRKANELIVTEYRALEIYTILALEYLALVLILSAGVRWLERRMGADERTAR